MKRRALILCEQRRPHAGILLALALTIQIGEEQEGDGLASIQPATAIFVLRNITAAVLLFMIFHLLCLQELLQEDFNEHNK